MPHTQRIELTLRLDVGDESTAARIAEMTARFMLGVSAENDVTAFMDIDRYEVACDHEHGEVQP